MLQFDIRTKEIGDDGRVLETYYRDDGSVSHTVQYSIPDKSILLYLDKLSLIADGTDSIEATIKLYDNYAEQFVTESNTINININQREFTADMVDGEAKVIFNTTVPGDYFIIAQLEDCIPSIPVEFRAYV